MAKVSFEDSVTAVVEELANRCNDHEGSWDNDFLHAVARHEFSKWMAEVRDPILATSVADQLSARLILADGRGVSLEWYESESERRLADLVEQQRDVCDDIDHAKSSLEAASERKKAAQSEIEECHSQLRRLARELNKPFVFDLPRTPERQKDLPIMDGEEWKQVPLAEVLESNVALKSVVADKLGPVTLGEYAELAEKFSGGDKPKKLTRKQWDAVEELVQQWHANAETEPATS